MLDCANEIADIDRRMQEIYKEILTTVADENLAVPLSYTHETFAYNAEKIKSDSKIRKGRSINITPIFKTFPKKLYPFINPFTGFKIFLSLSSDDS